MRRSTCCLPSEIKYIVDDTIGRRSRESLPVLMQQQSTASRVDDRQSNAPCPETSNPPVKSTVLREELSEEGRIGPPGAASFANKVDSRGSQV